MDLKAFVAKLDKARDLVRIKRPVSTKYEIAAIIDLVDKTTGQAVLFERVRGYGTPVIGNLLSHRRRFALALGVAEDALRKEYSKRVKRRIKPKLVARGPLMETIVERDVNILKEVPVLTYRERDASPYFSSAVTVARDPVTGATGMGIYRIQVRGRNEVSLNFQNPPLTDFLRTAEAMGKELEVAIVVGLDPLTFVASVFPVPPGTDRFDVAGGLHGKAVELVKCRTIGVLVPAGAEFVLEGRVKPGLRVHEGPFGESGGTYHEGRNPVATITAIMHRKKPIYQALLSYSGEDTTLLGLLLEVTLFESLRAEHPGIISVALDKFNRSNLIVRMRKKDNGEPRKVLKQVLTSAPIVKTAMVVDEDIDPDDPCALGFAMGTRFQPKRGTVVIDETRSSSLDPSAVSTKSGRVSSKLGIDATRPLAAPKEKFEMVRMSKKMKAFAKAFEKQLKVEAARARLHGSVRRYDRPLDPVIDPAEWDANR
ncbi:MAG: UbiD family decarboxylase [Betaproteobacteria bacterium]|nr:UbiD family decarboxylase [Betaproteobacteria bacterium]